MRASTPTTGVSSVEILISWSMWLFSESYAVPVVFAAADNSEVNCPRVSAKVRIGSTA
ncbi:hypothetical protein MYIN104542_23895 [Mycobacterium intermedium]